MFFPSSFPCFLNIKYFTEPCTTLNTKSRKIAEQFFFIGGSQNNEINIKGIPDYKMPSADKYLEHDEDFVLRAVMTQTMMSMMMIVMSSKHKAGSLNKLSSQSSHNCAAILKIYTEPIQ